MVAVFAKPDALPGAEGEAIDAAAGFDRQGELGAEQAGEYVGGHVTHTAEMDVVWTPVHPMATGRRDFLAVHIDSLAYGHLTHDFVHISVTLHAQ